MAVTYEWRGNVTTTELNRLHAEAFEQPARLRTEEAHREVDALGRQLEVRALDLLELAVAHLDFVRAQGAHAKVGS